ncbi:hypothetical protein BaRGS_00034594 [Batillaria attramentaria]|uniref:G-protein coupled receptors family 1 profile domain-containing protein n=1 Tax=Batillaria attramentaria TaxID=370345 RepID=A0ABD0JH32_9CAEN
MEKVPVGNVSVMSDLASMNKSERDVTFGHSSSNDTLILQTCEKAGELPVTSLGIIGNVLVLWVWQADSSFIPATFFIKYLATCDLLFSASTFVKIFDFMPVVVVSSFTTFFIKMSVHVTLALAVSRCVAVYRPLRVTLILSRRRVIVVSVVIACWCFLLQGLQLCSRYVILFGDDYDKRSILAICFLFLSYCLPLLPMVGCNVALLCKVYRRDVTSHMSHDQARASRQQTRRLTLGVVCITTTSVLAYPVIFSVITPIRWKQPAYLVTFNIIASCVSNLLIGINSSINVIYYVIFASEFRRLLVLRFTRLWGCCKRRYAGY